MAVTVPIDLDVQGGGLADAVERDLRGSRAVAAREGGRAGDAYSDAFSREAVSAAAEVEAALSEATRDRTAEIDVDIQGMANLAELRESLDLAKQRAEVARLEEALEDVAKLRRAGVDVEVSGQTELAALDRALKAVERHVTIDVDVDRDALGGVARAASQAAGGTSSAFSDAFSLIARNAVILIAAVAAAMYALPVVGAVAAAGIVLAFGAGLAGLGIVAAAQSESVRKAFSGMADGIVKDMRRIAAPFENTLIAISQMITRTFDQFAPALEKSFADIAPALTLFSNDFFKAFENLEPAIQPLTDAFTDLLDAIGPRLDGFFTGLSDSITGLSETISADPDLFAGLFVGLLNVIPAILNGINGLAQAFVFVYELISSELGPAIEEFKTAFAPVGELFSNATGGMSVWQAALAAVGFVLVSVVKTIRNMIIALAAIANAVRATAGAISGAWANVSASTSAAWGRVRAVVTGAANAVRATVSRATASVVAAFAGAWGRVRASTSAALATVRSVVSGGMRAVQSVVTGSLGRVRAAFSSGFNAARSVVVSAIGRIRSAVSAGISSVVSVVSGLPGRIRGALGNLGSLLYSSGYSMISGLASGIRAGIGNAVSAASSALGAVRNLFPFSPAKEGPFSGKGYTTYSGEALMRDFAKSVEDAASAVVPAVSGALDPIANAVSAPEIGRRATTSSTTTVTNNNGVPASALANMLGGLQIVVQPGMDRRATAELWLNGKRYAEALA